MAHYQTYDEMLRSSNPVKGKKIVEKQADAVEPSSDEPEVAKSNRWFVLKDGTMVAIKKGEKLPNGDEIEKSTTQKEYSEWKESQSEDDSEGSGDEGKA